MVREYHRARPHGRPHRRSCSPGVKAPSAIAPLEESDEAAHLTLEDYRCGYAYPGAHHDLILLVVGCPCARLGTLHGDLHPQIHLALRVGEVFWHGELLKDHLLAQFLEGLDQLPGQPVRWVHAPETTSSGMRCRVTGYESRGSPTLSAHGGSYWVRSTPSRFLAPSSTIEPPNLFRYKFSGLICTFSASLATIRGKTRTGNLLPLRVSRRTPGPRPARAPRRRRSSIMPPITPRSRRRGIVGRAPVIGTHRSV